MSEFQVSEVANSILKSRYFQPGENWDDLCLRVATAISKSEDKANQKSIKEKFYNFLVQGKGLLNTPALVNLGTGKVGCVAACFSFRPEDNMHSIMEVGRLTAFTLKFGGGVGFEFSLLRPKGFPIQSTHKFAMGPTGVMKLYNAIGEVITQGGIRPSALMAILRIDHPDIIKFCQAKRKDGTLANFNNTVSIPDGFMKKLSSSPYKPHVCWFNNKQYHVLPDGESILRADRGSRKVLSVKEIYNFICESASSNGDPGVYFVDHANRNNPLINGINDVENPFYHAGCNPCIRKGQKLLTLMGWRKVEDLVDQEVKLFDGDHFTSGKVWHTGYKEILRIITSNGKTLDVTPDHKVFSAKGWIPACECEGETLRIIDLKETPNSNKEYISMASIKRDITEVIKVKYLDIKDDVYDFSSPNTHAGIVNSLTVHNCSEISLSSKEACVLGSVDLAKFVIDGELDMPGLSNAFKTMTRMLDNSITVSDWPDPSIKEKVLETRRIGVGIMGFASTLDKLGIRYGSKECIKLTNVIGTLRKSACSEESISLAKERGVYPAAPEGEQHRNVARLTCPPTGSLAILANTSWGLEPHLYWAFEERRNNTVKVRYLPAIKDYIDSEVLEELIDEANGDLPYLNDLIQAKLPDHMILSKNVTPEEHLEVVTEWQKHTDNGISKTICAPTEILTKEKVSEIYRSAWENKLKGITVYPEGSREGEPMSIKQMKLKEFERIPKQLKSDRYEFEVLLGNQMKKTFCFVGLHPEDETRPLEIFLKHPHVQDPMAIQFIDLTTRLLSLVLRYRQCYNCKEEAIPLGQVIKNLRETDGQSMFSVPSIFVKTLGKYLPKGESVGRCPVNECDGQLILIEGCESCLSCGFRSCS
jgi:ribonucleoside-diphosphate reductase alpha chain